MEKAGKDKYWLLEQLGRQRLKVGATPALTTVEILQICPATFLEAIFETLRNSIPELEPPRYTDTYHWFFTDIVAGANPDVATDDQTRKILAFNNLIRKTYTFRTRDRNSTKVIPTGDGVAIGFKDHPELPLLLAIEIHKELNGYNQREAGKNRLELRIGLDTGPVYPIIDLNDKENVWGPGIIYARRIMDLGGAKHILASTRYANDVEKLKPEFKKLMHVVPGKYPIKHNEDISISNIYGNIYGSEIGTKQEPPKKGIERSATERELADSANTFIFDSIEIILKILDPKTMLTHHTWIWRPVNQRDQPVERVFYYLDGDVSKDFPDLNIKVTDEAGKELQIQSIGVNKPLHKEFFVQLTKPFKPKQKGRSVRLEYDWEEPDRQYVYSFASTCRKFRYLMIAPKDMPTSQKVVRILREIGEKEHAPNPATVRYFEDRTEIEWTSHDLRPFDTYRFDW